MHQTDLPLAVFMVFFSVYLAAWLINTDRDSDNDPLFNITQTFKRDYFPGSVPRFSYLSSSKSIALSYMHMFDSAAALLHKQYPRQCSKKTETTNA